MSGQFLPQTPSNIVINTTSPSTNTSTPAPTPAPAPTVVVVQSSGNSLKDRGSGCNVTIGIISALFFFPISLLWCCCLSSRGRQAYGCTLLLMIIIGAVASGLSLSSN